MFYLKQLAAVHLPTPAHLSTTPSLFKYKSCITENATVLNLKLSPSSLLCPWIGLSKCWSYVLCCKHISRHHCASRAIKRHWPSQVVLVNTVCVSLLALNVALVRDIWLTPRLYSSTKQRVKVTFVCSQIRTISGNDKVQQPPKSQESLPLISVTLSLVYGQSVVEPCCLKWQHGGRWYSFRLANGPNRNSGEAVST